jgi:hypothetical protein
MCGGSVPYERDMKIIHDPITKSVLIDFRGTVTVLGPFLDKVTAIKAAEDFCRGKGWAG